LTLLVLAAAVAAVACGGSAKERSRRGVNAYFTSVDRAQARYAAAFRAADTALRSSFASGPAAVPRLRAAAAAIADAGAAVRRIEPPPEARRIHRDLLLLYAREAGLAREVRDLAAFLAAARRALASLGRANASLRGRRAPAGEAAALAAYARRVDQVARRLASLRAPPALRPWQAEQVAWLRGLAPGARRLAGALRGGGGAARELTVAFRAQLARQPGVTRAQRRAVAAYDARVRDVAALRQRIEREREALARRLA
jgi:hypothetical protein